MGTTVRSCVGAVLGELQTVGSPRRIPWEQGQRLTMANNEALWMVHFPALPGGRRREWMEEDVCHLVLDSPYAQSVLSLIIIGE